MAHGLAPIGRDGYEVRVQEMRTSAPNNYVEVFGTAPRGDEFTRQLSLDKEGDYWRTRTRR